MKVVLRLAQSALPFVICDLLFETFHSFAPSVTLFKWPKKGVSIYFSIIKSYPIFTKIIFNVIKFDGCKTKQFKNKKISPKV
jgi:hypothetical protein